MELPGRTILGAIQLREHVNRPQTAHILHSSTETLRTRAFDVGHEVRTLGFHIDKAA
jgi:hypothetical protein